MSKANITDYKSLEAEKNRLKELFACQRQMLNAEVVGIKQHLEPVANIIDVVNLIVSRNNSLGLVNRGINVVVEMLVEKVLLRNAGWFKKMIVSFITKNVVSHLAANKMEEEFPTLKKVLKTLSR